MYKALDVTKICRISQNLLTQWIDRKFIRACEPASGSGTRNKFTVTGICRIEIFKQLNANGFTRPAASGVAFSKLTISDDIVLRQIEKTVTSLKNHNASTKTSILLDPPMPKPGYMTFEQTKEGVLVSEILKSDDFAALYQNMNNATVFVVINLTQIAIDVLNKIKKLGL